MNRQLIFFLLFALLLGGTGYVWYTYSQTSVPAEVTETSESAETRLSRLRKLKNLQLDTSILEDSSFRSFELFGADLPTQQAESRGRANPFLSP